MKRQFTQPPIPKQHVFLWVCRVIVLSLLTFAGFQTAAQQVPDKPTVDAAQLEKLVQFGEFSLAKQLANQLPPVERDRWLAQISRRQWETGAYWGAADTLGSIGNSQLRRSLADSMRQPPPGARGGVTEDDFQPLIDLITNTIAPDSWDVNGGNGAIMPFVAGVYVDTQGVLRRITDADNTRLEWLRREGASRRAAADVRRASPLRKVSLVALERAVEMRWAQGLPPDESMRHLAGLTDIQYLFVYPEIGDIVIAGPAGGWRAGPDGVMVSEATGGPVILLDDLVTMLRRFRQSSAPFGCSINPRQENLERAQQFLAESSRRPLRPGEQRTWLEQLRKIVGLQDIEVFGVDPRSHVARVLVEADYRMKLVGLGLEEGVLGVPNYLDLLAEHGALPDMTVLRWWFAMKYDVVRANADRTAFALEGSAVQVLSENEMLAARGQRVPTGRSDEPSSRFASSFTRHFDQLAAKYPVYGELRNVFHLALVASLIETHGLADQIDWPMSHFLDNQAYIIPVDSVPRCVESVANGRSFGNRKFVGVVSGGVWAEPMRWAAPQALASDQNGELERERSYADRQQPTVDPYRWWWD